MPIHVICDSCSAEYDLKDEHGGKYVKCPKCQGIIDVPPAKAKDDEAATRRDAPSAGHPAFHRDKFLLRQKHLSISEKYFVWDEAGNELLFVKRPAHLMRNLLSLFVAIFIAIGGLILLVFGASRLPEGVAQEIGYGIGALVVVVASSAAFLAIRPKRHIGFYADSNMSELVLKTFQDQKLALLNATYTVTDAENQLLGTFRKNYLYNIIRKRWYCYDADGSLLVVAKEDSLILALLRRFLGNLYGILRSNYIFLRPDQESALYDPADAADYDRKVIGEFNRKFTLLDRYVLDMSQDQGHVLDRRLTVALGVLLDTGERR